MSSIERSRTNTNIFGSVRPLQGDEGDGREQPFADRPTSLRASDAGKSAASVADMIMARYGAGRSLHDLARSASASGQGARRQEISLQIRKAAEKLFPVAQMIRAHGLGLPIIAAANISVTAKIGGGRRLWAYAATGNDMKLKGKVFTPRSIWFQVTPDRVGGYARKEMSGFKGVLIAPPGTGYEGVIQAGLCTYAGCWHHIAMQARELELIGTHPVIEATMRAISALRAVEDDAAKLSNRERARIRQMHSAPVLHTLNATLCEAQSAVPPRSALGKFIADTLDQWPRLTLFLTDGALPMENGAVERILERLSWRDRWIFSWHPNAHLWSATIFTILETCAANNIDSRSYLTTLLEMLQGNSARETLHEALPWHFGAGAK